MEILKIGTLVYIVHKSWPAITGARVTPARIAGHQNINGEILPVLKSGSKEISPSNHHIFTDLKEAVESIKTKKKSVKP